MFQLRREEFDSLTSQITISKPKNSSQIAMSKTGRGARRSLPYAFTARCVASSECSSQPARRPDERVRHPSIRQDAPNAPWHQRACEKTWRAREKAHRSIGRARDGHCASSARSNADPQSAAKTDSAASTDWIYTLLPASALPGSLAKAFRLKQPLLKLNQTAACGTGDCFGAADDIHLSEDRFHVRFHGAFADE
jgi:hypothetical protein